MSMRIIMFSSFKEHSAPFFRLLNILKLPDLVTFQNALFMFQFHNNLSHPYFGTFFNLVENIPNYTTPVTLLTSCKNKLWNF